jgi:hypothetical protein
VKALHPAHAFRATHRIQVLATPMLGQQSGEWLGLESARLIALDQNALVWQTQTRRIV